MTLGELRKQIDRWAASWNLTDDSPVFIETYGGTWNDVADVQAQTDADVDGPALILRADQEESH